MVGGDEYPVYIEKYFFGAIVKLNEQWLGHMNTKVISAIGL